MFCTPLSMFQCISAFETVCFCDISRIYWWIFARHCPCFNASVRPRLYVSVISPVSVDGFLHATVHVSMHQCVRDCMFLWYLPYLLMDFCTPLSMFQCISASETVCFCDISRICWWIFARHCPCFSASVHPRLHVSVISPVSVDGFLHATVHVSMHPCVRDCMFLWYLPYLLMDFCQTFVIGVPCDKDELIRFCVKRSRSHTLWRWRRPALDTAVGWSFLVMLMI